MATIEELLRESEDVLEAELDALDQLNGHIAEIAGGLPRGSLLARRLAKMVPEFERTIQHRGRGERPGDVAFIELFGMARESEADLNEVDPPEEG